MLGVGLAMDAFSVSLADGLNDPDMPQRTMHKIAGVFAGFQFLMPMIGWLLVHTAVTVFSAFQGWIPWIALILLSYIGGKMILEGIRPQEAEAETGGRVDTHTLVMQGIATSIDALSVGFTISDYNALQAFGASLIIAVVTFVICEAGLRIGRKAGTALSGKASIFGGVILIAIGLNIFLGR